MILNNAPAHKAIVSNVAEIGELGVEPEAAFTDPVQENANQTGAYSSF